MMKFQVVITIVFSVILLAPNAASLEDGVVRIYPDLFDTKVVYAVYAINEYLKGNLHDEGMRTATRVVSATAKVTQGIVYEYEIEVTNGTTTETCRAVVESIPWLQAPGNNNSLALRGDVDCVHPEHKDSSAPNTQGQGNSTTPAAGPLTVTGDGILFKFSLRMVVSKCVKTDLSVFGKITLDECPPLKDEFITQRNDKQKCVAKILWNPTDMHRPYIFHDYYCRLGI